MSIDTAVGFVLKGADAPTIWFAFEYKKGFQHELAAGLASALKSDHKDFTRAEAAAFIFLNLADFADQYDRRFGIAYSKPDGLTHTTHVVDLGKNGGVSLRDPETDDEKVNFSWRAFVERAGFSL